MKIHVAYSYCFELIYIFTSVTFTGGDLNTPALVVASQHADSHLFVAEIEVAKMVTIPVVCLAFLSVVAPLPIHKRDS